MHKENIEMSSVVVMKMNSPGGVPCIVAGVFKQTVKLCRNLFIGWNLLGGRNVLRIHLPLMIVCCH